MPHKTIEARRAYRRLWYQRNREKHHASIVRTAEHRKRERERQSPEKKRARWVLWDAIRYKKIERPDECSKCHRECRPEAHHSDYGKPLEVVWLCSSCHGETRRKDQP